MEFSLARAIWRTAPPVILAVGSLGSFLSILVLTRRRLRQLTTMFYLAVLAVADLAVLYTGLVRLWLDNVFEIYIRLTSDLACKLHTLLVYFSLDFSVWILVAVTVDRCILLSAPFAARKWCTVARAKRTVVGIAGTLGVIHAHYLWSISLIQESSLGIAGSEVYSCYTNHNRFMAIFILKVWPWIDFSLVCLIPFSVMLVCNCVIVRQLVLSARQLRKHSEVGITGHSASNLSLTIMLLTVSTLFWLLTAPVAVFVIVYPYWEEGNDAKVHAQLVLGWSLVNILQYCNNAIHFFLYCLTGRKFREELAAVFGRPSRHLARNRTVLSSIAN